MKTPNKIILLLAAIMLFAMAITANATTEWVVPGSNGTVSNSTATTLTVQVLSKTTTANFTVLNISRYQAGTANISVYFFNMTNATNENHTITADCTSLADGVYIYDAIPYNDSARVAGTGAQNMTLTCDDTSGTITSVSPTDGLDDTTSVTLTVGFGATCRYDIEDVTFHNMSNTIAGNGTSLNLTNPAGPDMDRVFYFLCQDEYQNTVSSSFAQRFQHKGRANAAGLAISTQAVVNQAAVGKSRFAAAIASLPAPARFLLFAGTAVAVVVGVMSLVGRAKRKRR